MKKRAKIIALTTAAMLLVSSIGFGTMGTVEAHKETKKSERISVEEANKLALAVKPGKIKSVELEKDDGRVYYDYEVLINNKLYDIHIDAYSGKTLKVELEKVYTRTKTIDIQKKKENNKKHTSTKKKSKKRLTSKEAASIAAKHVQGKVEDIDLDKDDGRYIYEVELKTKRGEVDVDVDAYSGKILKVDYDDNDNDDDDDDRYDD
ncbi:PepSY domain-containing protein [Paenibacillus yanchengensis]|uniref:PepSY domain-containing protein n=1 Tax=Paenibacillus yanchengensis TaxID=2035833 RepID=A0ABW4YNT7_9BACL